MCGRSPHNVARYVHASMITGRTRGFGHASAPRFARSLRACPRRVRRRRPPPTAASPLPLNPPPGGGRWVGGGGSKPTPRRRSAPSRMEGILPTCGGRPTRRPPPPAPPHSPPRPGGTVASPGPAAPSRVEFLHAAGHNRRQQGGGVDVPLRTPGTPVGHTRPACFFVPRPAEVPPLPMQVHTSPIQIRQVKLETIRVEKLSAAGVFASPDVDL